MHLPFLNRSNIKSPLASLRSTPGLVACYLPYLDVVGRNVGSTTPSLWNFTFNSNKIVKGNGKTSGECLFGARVTAGTRSIFKVWVAKAEYDYCRIDTRSGYTGSGWAWFVVDLNTGEVYDEQIGTIYSFIHSRTITWDDDLSAWCITVDYTYNYTNSSGAISVYGTPDGTYLYTGDGTSGMYGYQWQHNLGTTLYPYSAPEGLPQTVVDRSRNGNDRQLGSTSGVDADDPTWGANGKWLEFDGVDDIIADGPSATTVWTLLGDASGNALGWVRGKRTNVAGRMYAELRFSRVPTEAERVRLFANVEKLLTGQGITGTFYDWAYPIPCTAGLMDFSIKNGDDRLWVFPDTTTSTAERPAKTLNAAGTTWAYISNWADGDIEIYDNNTDARYVGDLADLPPVLTYYLSLHNCSNVTGDLSDVSGVTYYLSLAYCTNITGDLSDVSGLTHLLSLTNCANITGDLSDVSGLTYHLGLSNCTNITGDLSDVSGLTYYLDLYNCSNVTGDLSYVSGLTYYLSLTNCTNVTGTLQPEASIRYIYLAGTGLNTTQLDNSIIAVNAVTTATGTRIFNWSTGVRSSTSDDAYDSLVIKGWSLTAREW